MAKSSKIEFKDIRLSHRDAHLSTKPVTASTAKKMFPDFGRCFFKGEFKLIDFLYGEDQGDDKDTLMKECDGLNVWITDGTELFAVSIHYPGKELKVDKISAREAQKGARIFYIDTVARKRTPPEDII